MNASIAIQVLPTAKEGYMIPVIDKVIRHIQAQEDIHTFVGPFETTMEGDFDRLMRIVRECTELCVSEGASSVMAYVKIHYSPENGVLTIDEKTKKYL